MQNNRSILLSAVVSAAVAAVGCKASAQDAPRGLDALNESRVLSELSRRNLGALLEYAFEKNNTPPAQRDAIKASSALARLQKEKETMKLDEKRQLLHTYVKALPTLLPQMNDAKTLIDDSIVLMEHGVTQDQLLLEYFGTNSSIMARLQPIASGSQAMLARAHELASAAADKAMNNWPAGRVAWEAADRQMSDAEYMRQSLNYTAAISLDKAAEARAKAIDQALAYFPDLDTEENPNRAFAQVYLGKLNLAKGTKESLEQARTYFKKVITGGNPKELGQQADVRLAAVVTEIEAKNVAAAKTALADFEAWAKANKLDAQDGTQGAIAAMNYRLLNLQSELATGEDKKKYAFAAVDVLDKLQQKQPNLRSLILELMGSTVKADTPVADLNVLLLQSLRATAEAEVIKPDGAEFDKKAIERGIDAAKEIIKRGGKDNEKIIADSMYALGFFYRKLDRKQEMALAFLDYLDKYKTKDEDRANVAFNNAGAAARELFLQGGGDPAVTKLYDRVLETAVNPPFQRMEHAFEFARRLQVKGKPDEALAWFAKVPADSKAAGDALFFRLVVTQQKLLKLPSNDAGRAKVLTDLQTLADQVNKRFEEQLKSADNPNMRAIFKTRLAQTRLLAADVAMGEQKNAKRAIEQLDGFEQMVEGLPDAPKLIEQVLAIRVQAFIQLQQVSEATKELVRLAEKRPKEVGQIVFNLLQTLEEKRVQAEADKRFDLAAEYQANRAALTPFFVKWVTESSDPELKKQAYNAALFDAGTQLQAAESTKDEARRKELLQASLKRFEELNSPAQIEQMLKLLKESATKAADDAVKAKAAADALPDAPKEAKAAALAKAESEAVIAKGAEQRLKSATSRKYDREVLVGLGRVYFALGDYDKARMQFARLLNDKVLGDYVFVRTTPAGIEEVENAVLWEATYKLIKSNVVLNANVDGMKGWLRTLHTNWQSQLGGARWGDEFKALMKELQIDPTPAPATP